MIEYWRTFDTKGEADAYARTLKNYLTIVVFQSKMDRKWYVTAN